jgi:DNA-binding transcriptional regulator GbsR (MarR family)
VSILTLGEASKLTGVSKPTISNAVTKGKITGKKNKKGIFEIEKSELLRVYPEKKQGEQKPLVLSKEMSSQVQEMENKHLQEKVDDLQKRLEKAEAREDAANKRLDTVLLQLEDQRPKGFWGRLRGK